jgi:two-component system response regulator LytT
MLETIKSRCMKVLIVENEKKEAVKLARLLKLIDPTITILKTVETLPAAFGWIEQNTTTDLVLINQARFSNHDFPTQTIVAKLVLYTRQHQLTYLAFRANAIQQLQTLSQLPHPKAKGFPLQAIAKQSPEPAYKNFLTSVQPLFKNRFFVESGQKFLSIDVNDIAYFFSDGRLVYFTTFTKNKYVIQYRMEELEQVLNPQDFYRVNRSFIASVKCIDQIHSYFGGRFKLKLNPVHEEEILVSRKRASGFKAWLGE